MKPDELQVLTDMPNIGREVAGLLSRAGIDTPKKLVHMGAVEAAIRIRGIRPDDPPSCLPDSMVLFVECGGISSRRPREKTCGRNTRLEPTHSTARAGAACP